MEQAVQAPVRAGSGTRELYLDALRVIAAFCVMVNHSITYVFLAMSPGKSWYAAMTEFFLSKTAVPIFLMISGVTLLTRRYTYRKTLEKFLHTLLVLVVFSGLYYLEGHLDAGTMGEASLGDFLESVWQRNVTNAFWYLYLYLGILAMLPLLQRLAGALDKTDLRYALFISLGVLGLFPVLTIWFPSLAYCGHFSVPLLDTYVGLMLGGLYIHKYTEPSRRGAAAAVGVFLGMIALQVLLTRQLYDFMGPENYLQMDSLGRYLPTTASALALFYLFRHYFGRWKLSPRGEKVLSALGRLSFGVYLLSDLMLAKAYPVSDVLRGWGMHVIPAIFLYQLVSLAIGYALAFLLSRIPGIRRLIR